MPLFRPGKPYALLTLSANANQASSPLTVPFDTVESDGEIMVVAGSCEIEVAGLYVVTASLGHTAGTGAQSSAMEIHRNGSVVAMAQSVSSAGRIGTAGSFTDQLSVGDTISLVSSNLALTGGKQTDAGVTRLAVTRIGPVRWT